MTITDKERRTLLAALSAAIFDEESLIDAYTVSLPDQRSRVRRGAAKVVRSSEATIRRYEKLKSKLHISPKRSSK